MNEFFKFTVAITVEKARWQLMTICARFYEKAHTYDIYMWERERKTRSKYRKVIEKIWNKLQWNYQQKLYINRNGIVQDIYFENMWIKMLTHLLYIFIIERNIMHLYLTIIQPITQHLSKQLTQMAVHLVPQNCLDSLLPRDWR